MRRCSGASLFGLAPCGVLPAICLTADAVRSYRTFSPLPRHSARESATAGGIFSVPLVLQVTLTGRYPAHCPSEFGLSSHLAASDHLADCNNLLLYLSRPFLVGSRTAPASCRDCCVVCRSPRPSSRYSRRFRAASPPAMHARPIP